MNDSTAPDDRVRAYTLALDSTHITENEASMAAALARSFDRGAAFKMNSASSVGFEVPWSTNARERNAAESYTDTSAFPVGSMGTTARRF